MSFFKKLFPNLFPSEEDLTNRVLNPISMEFDPERTISITIPDLKAEKITIEKWMYRLGDRIKKNTALCELVSDRYHFEFESFNSGKLVWMQPKGAILNPGDICCRIEIEN